jgi:predicted alpha/beta-fold hydrolase
MRYSTIDTKFKPAFGLANKHVQTIYPTLFRKLSPIDFEIEPFHLSDGDFLECYWSKIQNHTSSTPIVILFHGLAGSYNSPYIQGSVKSLNKEGFNTVIMHYRGTSGKENNLARSYHSGDSADAFAYISSLKDRYERAKLFAVGYSLGANMLLKLLGEYRDNSHLDGAVAVSAPMRLDICADSMNKGVSKFYQKLLLKDLNASLDKKYDTHDMQSLINLQREDIKNLKTFWDFDTAYTAPIHGFSSAQDYYTKSSARQFLKDIETPTLIIHALDDPFMTPEVLPKESEVSKNVTLEISQKGGHVGFISGSIFQPKYWLEKRIVDYFTSDALSLVS